MKKITIVCKLFDFCMFNIELINTLHKFKLTIIKKLHDIDDKYPGYF
jgi:hypothetical protein